MSDSLIIGNKTIVEDMTGINVIQKLLRSTKIKVMNGRLKIVLKGFDSERYLSKYHKRQEHRIIMLGMKYKWSVNRYSKLWDYMPSKAVV